MSGVPAEVIQRELGIAAERCRRLLGVLDDKRAGREHDYGDFKVTYLLKIQAVTAHLSAVEIAAYDL